VEIEILGMMEYTTVTVTGQREAFVRVTYRTETGYTGSVDVPKVEFSEAKVKELIQKEIPAGTELIGKKIKVGLTKAKE